MTTTVGNMSSVSFPVGATLASRKSRVLFIPGFAADTYSEIEASYVELSSTEDPDIEFVWLVPRIDDPGLEYARLERKGALTEPLFVSHLKRKGVAYVEGSVSKFNIVKNFFLFRRLLREERIAAVYTHFGYERFWAVLFAKLWGKRTVWNEHWHSLGTRYVWPKRMFYHFFVDEFISVSRFISKTLPARKRIHTILNAIGGPAAGPLTEERRRTLKRSLGIPDTARIVLMVAAFRVEKRHDLALEVCGRVVAASRDTLFLFLGDGPLRRSFLASLGKLAWRDHVRAPGHVDDIETYYAIADICILTSYYEPFGYVVLEAMRHGVPMVAFDHGGPAEVIRHQETGVLIREGDVDGFAAAVNELLAHPVRRAAIGSNARRSALEDFSRDKWCKQIFKVFKESLRDRPMAHNDIG